MRAFGGSAGESYGRGQDSLFHAQKGRAFHLSAPALAAPHQSS